MSNTDELPDIEPIPMSSARKRASTAPHVENLKKARAAKAKKKVTAIEAVNASSPPQQKSREGVKSVVKEPDDPLGASVEGIVHQSARVSEHVAGSIKEVEAIEIPHIGGRRVDVPASEEAMIRVHEITQKTGVGGGVGMPLVGVPFTYLHPNKPSDPQFNKKGEVFDPFIPIKGFDPRQRSMPQKDSTLTILF